MAGPLEGVKIVDLTNVIAGPMATALLADQGADVIKIERPGIGDLARYLGPSRGGLSAMFITTNRNKRSIALDLGSDEGKTILRELIGDADVFVENFRPGAIERLGFGHEEVRALNERMIYVTMSGFGPTGPYAAHRVYDPVIQVTSGFAATQMNPETGKPELVRSIVCDKVSALTVAQAITAALYGRDARGAGGQRLELSMLNAAIAFIWPDGMYNHTFLSGDVPPQPNFSDFYAIFETADGFVTVIALSDDEFQGLCRAAGVPELAKDERFATIASRMHHVEALRLVVGDKLRNVPTEEAIRRLHAEDVPAAKYNALAEVAEDPQVIHNAVLAQVEHPLAGPVRIPKAAASFDATPTTLRHPAPALGEHTDEVLAELGRDAAAIAGLRERGVVA